MAKITEIRDLPDDALIDRLESDKEELFNLRFQLATGQLDNPMRIKQVRHDVARVLTILREREIELHEGSQEHEEAIQKADAEALREGREEQAKHPGKGSSLKDAIATSGPEEGYTTGEHALQTLESGGHGKKSGEDEDDDE